ncbi:Cerato-platanin [Dichomitus squalens]|uniref:Cerato-platanin n=1 Tax=Dichomitus squalens TaxID=114155 RepID=A0A4Q9NKC5_9APHY|nr:Cerato-platanin [Dichomitus squalens]TBU57052.1 Cerato-platanin [Dichomitus squalens]
MQFKTFTLSILAAFIPTALGATTSSSVSVSYDQTYDNGSNSLATTACSDGSHGLLTKGFTTFDSLPSFPYVGGAGVIPGWNSDQCGTCWELSYNGKSIHVLAIDHADAGTWNIALAALNDLTNGQATEVGRVDAVAALVDSSVCGL